MGYCYNCRSWKQNKGTLEQQLFGECTDKHFINMTEAHSMTNIDGAGFIGPNMDGVKFITGKRFSCRHFDYMNVSERPGYVPQKKAEHPKLKIILKNDIKGTTHLVRTYDGKLNHAQVYNAMRVLCGDVKCTDCDVAGCHPSQVKIIRQVVPARDNVYQINQKDIAEAVSRRVKAQAGDHITDFSQEEYLSKLPVSPKTVDEVVDRLISGINLRSRVMIANMSLDQLMDLHFDLFAYLNSPDFWTGNKELIESCSALSKEPVLNGDDVAAVIIGVLWKRIREGHKLKVVK